VFGVFRREQPFAPRKRGVGVRVSKHRTSIFNLKIQILNSLSLANCCLPCAYVAAVRLHHTRRRGKRLREGAVDVDAFG